MTRLSCKKNTLTGLIFTSNNIFISLTLWHAFRVCGPCWLFDFSILTLIFRFWMFDFSIFFFIWFFDFHRLPTTAKRRKRTRLPKSCGCGAPAWVWWPPTRGASWRPSACAGSSPSTTRPSWWCGPGLWRPWWRWSTIWCTKTPTKINWWGALFFLFFYSISSKTNS